MSNTIYNCAQQEFGFNDFHTDISHIITEVVMYFCFVVCCFAYCFFVWLHIKMAKRLFISHYLIQAFQHTICTFLESKKYVTLDKHKNIVIGIDCSSGSCAFTCFASIDGQISILHEQDNGQAQLFQKKKIWSTDQKKIEKGIDVKISPYHYYEDRKVIAYTENGILFIFWTWYACNDFKHLMDTHVINNNIDKSNNISMIGGNGYTICSGSHDKTLRIWDIETAKETTTFKHEHKVKSIKYGSD
ncbi:hypothetical protein RFI_19829 [Reticulomyxa filosa]|uniref:Uncharacterized protein n=1 Tax=Reticulomyxa filosa TaxID=46433 RepID=X6MU44_RETFI|nr:hypothetical protein RFI_19829 [Reticulomyxa filosa]|eukprot:ETO17493.1 hypothetical protein RFI_19829 [Reticulomyxa filosa]